MGERKAAYRVLFGKLEGKRPRRRPSCVWEENNKMGLQELGCGYTDWIDLAQVKDR